MLHGLLDHLHDVSTGRSNGATWCWRWPVREVGDGGEGGEERQAPWGDLSEERGEKRRTGKRIVGERGAGEWGRRWGQG